MLSTVVLTISLTLPEAFTTGRVAVITGAASGLGKAAAIKCASLGMKVCLADIDEPDLAVTAAECSQAAASPDDVFSMRTDVSSRTGARTTYGTPGPRAERVE